MLPHAAARLAEGCGPVETRLVSAYVRKLLKQRGGNGNG
jgi:hypothetical protein